MSPTMRWWLALAAALGLVGVLILSIGWLLIEGTGIWGNNIPVTWALDIVSYDWWIGLACGGLLVSSAMLLTGTPERDALSRITETMAVLAALGAAVYPIIHLGRPWFFYWNLPYPNTLALWPQVRSPLFWDAVDILAYLTVSLCLWYIGLLPDLASMRDRAAERILEGPPLYQNRRRLRAQLYGIAALGWRGSAGHWHRWRKAYRCLAVLGILMVPSLQSGAAVMFAGTQLPGWHDTMMPVSFVIGAAFSGVAATSLIAMVARGALDLGRVIDIRPISLLAWLMLGLGLADLYCECSELFGSMLSGNSYEIEAVRRRLFGDEAWAFWTMMTAGPIAAQVFWLPPLRRSPVAVATIGGSICLSMWAEHFMVIVTALEHDFLPSSAHGYQMGFWGLTTFAGSAGLFLFLLLLALRFLPAVMLSRHAQADAHPRVPFNEPAKDAPLWGITAEFDQPERMIEAARHMLHENGLIEPGLSRLDLYSPVPLQAMDDTLQLNSRGVSEAALTGGILGGLAMFGMCVYSSGYDYVINIGGRPRISWPSFVIPSFSFGLLSAAVCIMAVFLLKNRMPRLNHPAFNIPNFHHATHDRYFLVVEGLGEKFTADHALTALNALAATPLNISRVPR